MKLMKPFVYLNRYRRVLWIPALLILLGGCIPKDPIDDAVRAIDAAVESLDRGVASFEAIQQQLEGVVSNLDDGVYKRQASDLIHDVGQVAELSGAHMIDFTRTRVKEDLRNLKRALLGQPPIARTPVITTPSNSEIRFTDPGRGAIRVIGWNLDLASADPSTYGAKIVNASGERRVPKQFLHYTGQYAVSVDLSPSGMRLRHNDRALSFVGYAGEFSIPITDSSPPKDVTVVGTGRVKTDGSHARKIREDCEVHSDDWTLVKMAYQLRRVQGGVVQARVEWDVFEASKNKNPGNKTHIKSVKDWHRIWKLPQKYSHIVKFRSGERGSKQNWYKGEVHGWKSFPNLSGLSNVQVRFDGGGSDCGRQGMSADLSFRVLAQEKS